MSSNSTTSGSGVFNSLSSSKKDSIKQVFGEAKDLFEKFKNKKTPASSSSTENQTNSSSSIPQSSSFSSLLASAVDGQTSSSSLLQNLAISFHKSILNNQNVNSSSNNSANASSLNNTQEIPSKNSNSLVIIDDENFDDDEATFERQNLSSKNSNNFKGSQSEFNIKNVTISNQEQIDDFNASSTALSNNTKLTSSTSLYKVTPTNVDDFLQEASDHANGEEANLLRNRFQSKTKSNELPENNKVE